MVETTSTAEALQKSFDAEASDRSALEAVVTSVCEGARGVGVGIVAAESGRGPLLPGRGEDEGGAPHRGEEGPGSGELSLCRH